MAVLPGGRGRRGERAGTLLALVRKTAPLNPVETVSTYRAADGTALPLLVFEPPGGVAPSAGIVMFHGGALREGSAHRLAPHCRALAARGVLAVSAGYRLVGRGALGIDDCLADVRRAVADVVTLGSARGLDPGRLASGGSSAGAHLALVAAMAPEPTVAGVVALNPVVDLFAYPPEQRLTLERDAGIAPGSAAAYSPVELVRPGGPRVLVQHGTDDEVASVDQVRRFRDRMRKAGNDCVLLEYAGARHGFHYPEQGPHFPDVVDATAGWLVDRLAR